VRRFNFPVWLVGAPKPRAATFVTLFTLEAANRALLTTLIPLQAHAILGDARMVSVFYFSVSAVGLIASLGIPSVVHLFRRRWVYSAGLVIYIAACACFSMNSAETLILGLTLQVIAAACTEVTLNLYLLDHIPRRELKRFEPTRLWYAGVVFTAGPWLGVYLAQNVGEEVTYVVVAASAALALAVFWYLRITDNPAVAQPFRPPPNPMRSLPRFFSQKRLVLAWALAIGRNGWWLMFFVYTPIYVTEIGFPPEWGGAAVSLGLAPLLAVTFLGRLAERHGIRLVLALGYGGAGFATLLAASCMHGPLAEPLVGLGFLVLAAGFATIIDAAGNVPFLRAVHPYERAEMTSVFMTFRHVTSLVTPGVFALLLGFFPLVAVFAAGGVSFLCMTVLSRFIHPRL
jgi:ACDE family multidrug resistance protein